MSNYAMAYVNERTRWLAEQARGLRSDEPQCKLCGHGGDVHRYPVVCERCPERLCAERGPA